MRNVPLKLLGRHTGESPGVFLLRSFRYSGSDLSIFCTPNFLQMPELKTKSGQTNNSSLSTGPSESAEFIETRAAEAINMFTTFYPPEQAKETLWQLLATSLSCPEGDGFTPEERSNLLLFYRLTSELAEALFTLYPKTTKAD
jgi:hypothetical protein